MGRRSLSGSLIGGIAKTQEMLDFCALHDITADVEVIPIQKINEAYERMAKGDVKYRFSIDMASLKSEYAVRAGGDRTLLLVMPGWVKTDMGGDQAPLDVETSVRGIADAVAARSGTSGVSFIDHNNAVVPW